LDQPRPGDFASTAAAPGNRRHHTLSCDEREVIATFVPLQNNRRYWRTSFYWAAFVAAGDWR
jgi:hypothetical protein